MTKINKIMERYTCLHHKSRYVMRGANPLDTQYYMYFTVRHTAHREIVNVMSYCILRSTLLFTCELVFVYTIMSQ